MKVKKGTECKDKLEQIDTLTFGEETEKILALASIGDSFFVFMLNRETSKLHQAFKKIVASNRIN